MNKSDVLLRRQEHCFRGSTGGAQNTAARRARLDFARHEREVVALLLPVQPGSRPIRSGTWSVGAAAGRSPRLSARAASSKPSSART